MAIKIAPAEPAIADIRKRRRDMRALWRLCSWGGSAAIALAAVAITSQTEIGGERLALALANANEPVRAIAIVEAPPRAIVNDAETQRLAAQVRALTADRDQLTARIAGLERNLDDMTGSIKRQTAQAAATTPPADPPAPAPRAPDPAPPVIAPLAMPAISDTAVPWTAPPQAQAAAPAPEAVPLPPIRIAAAPASQPAAAPLPAKPEFGVDLGGAPNVEVLRTHWAAVKANYGPLLAGLSPVAAHDRRPGSTAYRLVAGPLPNAAAAARLCARFAAARAACRPAKFDGERLSQP